jgi:hypothetical protein
MKTLLLLLFGAMAYPQTITIADNSPANSPVSFRGTVDLSGADAVCSITGHNNGTLTIVAWGGQISGTKANGQPYTQPLFNRDHFFKSDAIISAMSPKPALDFQEILGCADFGHLGGAPATVSPTLSVAAVYVQFNDGSTWGDPTAIAEIMFQRKDAIAYLQSLQAKGGDLKAATAQMPVVVLNPGPHDHLLWERAITWSYLSDDTTSAAVAADIANRLALAQTHKAWLQ